MRSHTQRSPWDSSAMICTRVSSESAWNRRAASAAGGRDVVGTALTYQRMLICQRRPGLLLQLLEEDLAGLRDLGPHHRSAIALIGVSLIVVAMVVLRRVERLERLDLGHNRIVEHLILGEFRDHFL